MVAFSTTRLSSRGQVVIPEEIRKQLGLKPGCQFLVAAHNGAVMFRVITTPDMSRFDTLLAEIRKSAKAAGLRKSDITAAIKRDRLRQRRAA